VGDYAYVADAFAGLQIIDLAHPAQPTRLGTYETGGWAQDVEVVDHLAYVADLLTGLHIIDVSSPTNPVAVGRYDPSGSTLAVPESPNALKIMGPLAYLVGGNKLQVIDVSNHSLPVSVGTSGIDGYANGITVAGDRAYVTGWRRVGEDNEIGILQIFSLNSPTNPVPLGVTDIPSLGYGVAVAGDYAYVVGAETTLTVVDVSNPVNPSPVGRFHVYGWAQSVQVVQGRVFTAGEFTGLEVFNVDAPTDPLLIAQHPLGTGEDEGWDLDVIGNYACLARGHSGLLVFTIYEPSRINTVTRFENQLRIEWEGAPGLKLQRAASLVNGNWVDVPGSEGQSSTQLLMTGDSGFFRLLQP
jgi:hypothetical protein